MTSRQSQSAYAREAGPAVRRVRYAIQTGRLVRQPCVDCGETRVQAHHPRGYDDAHALDVEWVCRKHHLARHNRRYLPPWERQGQVKAYHAATGRVGQEHWHQFSNVSGPRRLLKVIELAWSYLRTDEEREYAVALIERLSQERAA